VYALLCETVSSAHAALGQLCRSFQSSLIVCETLPDHESIVTLRGLLSIAANTESQNARNPAQVAVQAAGHPALEAGKRASLSRTPSMKAAAAPDNDSSKGNTSKLLLHYKDFDDIPLANVVANVNFLSSERVFNRNSGLLDALEPDLDPGTPFDMLTFATSNVDDDHAFSSGGSDCSSSHASAEKRLIFHDAAACTLAKSAVRQLGARGGGLHRRLEDPGLKDFRLYLSAGYEKQERLYRAAFSRATGLREVASAGNIFAATSLFNKSLEGSALGPASRTLQRSAGELTLLHHLSLARRAYALVCRGRFAQALLVCTHAMRSKSSDAVMSRLLDDALRHAAAVLPGGGNADNRSRDADAWNVLLKQAAVEIHTFFVHIMAVACANMGSFLHAIKLCASWVAAIHVDPKWWFSASLSSFQLLAPHHLNSQLPLSQRQQFVAAAKAVTAMHLMCGQFSNEVMSACLHSCSKQRQQLHTSQGIAADSLSHSPSLESEMSAFRFIVEFFACGSVSYISQAGN